ncbi:hypothetical protein E3J79_02305 [Candidatus Dependentiae bacterium]|nr:MAG: hypothetical protein E3J79_02305 [Candidatus Dependentiae bacterium]
MKNLLYNFIRTYTSLFFFITLSVQAFDFPHFYRAAYFSGEPRFAKDKLTSIDCTVAAGSTCKARDCNGNTTCLFDIYGPHNMQKLGAGIPDKDPTNPADIALIYLSRVPGREGFAHLSFRGRFELIETIFSFTQNIKRGFFAQLFLPIKKIKVCNINYRDLSPTNSSCPNANHPYWQMFLNQFHDILARYCLCLCNYSKTDLGDVSFLFGWTCNIQETTVLDYIDATVKAGISIPSGRERCEDRIFDIPSGYNGHIGIPLIFDASIGAFEWLTLGIHGNFIPFFDKTKWIRMKTDLNQCGFIKLAKGCATVKKGIIFDINTYIKADHFARGISFLIGYTYNKKYKDELTPKDICLFDPNIVNTDQMLQEWEMHTIHFWAEYDFVTEEHKLAPRLALFYNWQIGGKRVLKTNMGGGTIGFDLAWDF